MWFKTEEEEAKERQDLLLSASGKEWIKDSLSSLFFSYFFVLSVLEAMMTLILLFKGIHE